jgi:hypothetical protein
MDGVYDYIEAYFTQTLSAGEKTEFEARCVNDKDFAGEVAFYVATRQVVREQLLQQKQAGWAAPEVQTAKVVAFKPRTKTFVQRMLPYAAAACVLLVASVYFLLQPASTQQLAKKYAEQNYSYINLVLGPQDSLEIAKEAFNKKDYSKALQLFELLQLSHSGSADEKKYAGLVYLFTQKYDQALQQFDALAKIPGLFTNEGNFLKAITLMERNAEGDKQQAKQLLEQVVKEHAYGSAQAEEWLKKF